MPQSRRKLLLEPGTWYMVLFIKGQSVTAVGMGDAEEPVVEEEGDEIWVVDEVGEVAVVVGVEELSLG